MILVIFGDENVGYNIACNSAGDPLLFKECLLAQAWINAKVPRGQVSLMQTISHRDIFSMQITNMGMLKQLASATDSPLECWLLLSGCCLSRKLVDYLPEEKLWTVFNFIDETEEIFQGDEDFENKYSIFFDAMRAGNLHCDSPIEFKVISTESYLQELI